MKKRKFTRILISVFVLAIAYLAYYQLFYKAHHVDSGIFRLNRVLADHTSEIWVAKFSPDGKWLASGSVDSTIKIWNRDSGTLLLSLKQPAGITYLNFSTDGNYLASASYDEKIRLWKLPEGTLVKELTGHKGTVWSLSFSPDGATIASSGEDATIRLWAVATGQLKKTLTGHHLNIWDVSFSPYGKIIASGSFDKTIKIWDANEGTLLRTLDAHSEAVVAIAFSHNGRLLASTSDDKTIRLWDTRSWKLLYTFHVPEHAQAVAFSPNDKLLVTGGRDKPALGEFLQNIFGDSKFNPGVSMRLWDAERHDLLQTFSFHANDVNDVDFSPDGSWIASASSDKTVGLWRLAK